MVGATRYLSQAEQNTRKTEFSVHLPGIAASQVYIYLYQGNTDAAAQLVQKRGYPLIQARVLIAQGDPSAALALLEP